jgi:thiol-disulfide isomerase/thioredoxin
VQAPLVEGKPWLTHAGRTRQLRAGGRFELAAGEPHAERYGATGAVFRAAWCGPCRMMAPAFAQAAQRLGPRAGAMPAADIVALAAA